MKRISYAAIALLMGTAVTLSSCKCENRKNANPAPAETETETEVEAEDDAVQEDIAYTIYQLIPQEDLPEEFVDLERPEDEEIDPLFFFQSVEGWQYENIDNGFYGYFNLQCYPLETGGWRAYYAAYAGMDGLCGFYQGGAYNYVDGELTRETEHLLPAPKAEAFLGEALKKELRSAGLYKEVVYSDFDPNYTYIFDAEGLGLTLDLDYLMYGEEEEEPAITASPELLSYHWDGLQLVPVE